MECDAECTYSDLLSSTANPGGAGCTEHTLFIDYKMKLQGYLKGSGKVGNLVTSMNSGVCIGREYNGSVTNPNTPKQVNQRARLKLMSQVAAAMSEVIAMPKQGLVSSRNLFIKANSPYSYANNGQADATLVNFQLTNGNIAIPAVTASREANNILHIELAAAADAAVSRICYCVFGKSTEQSLMYLGSYVIDAPGENRTFPTDSPDYVGDLIIYAYGMRDTSAKATAKYGNYSVSTGEDLAKLIMTRSLSASDYQLTKTTGVQLGSEETETPIVPVGSYQIVVHVSGLGSTTGQGVYPLGTAVTLTATPYAGWSFVGWRRNGTNVYYSRETRYVVPVSDNMDIIAEFISDTNSED